MDQFIKVAGTEGKLGGYFCRLPPLNENTVNVNIMLYFIMNYQSKNVIYFIMNYQSTEFFVIDRF